MILDETNTVRKIQTYVLHRCRPDDIRAYAPTRERLQAERQARYEAERQRRTAEAIAGNVFLRRVHELVLTLPCTRCGVAPEQACLNLVKLKQGEKVPTAQPHAQRFLEAELIAKREIKQAGQ